ncbi:uncharacterized protein LOC127734646 isoform X1 [Mytilus californianus]|uniref:uncharacterized protein LOC127734646 isoform X1 n=1 Tax=Mytilus californianus TaxID=6549 RepID=UPI002245C537|nr:uncharacterized protein LOC127734646 isoform X1 [Mytilus californianus]
MGVSFSGRKSKVVNQCTSDLDIFKHTDERVSDLVVYDLEEENETDNFADHKDVVECPPRYPTALAPTARRKDVSYNEKYKEATERVQTVPNSALGDYSILLRHLVDDVRSDLEKVWTLYLWVVSHDFSDHSHGKYPAGDTPKGYLRWIHDGEGDIASFFAILCRRAGIKCVIIDGISKGGDYEVGLSEQELEKMRDRWNAVYIDRNWRFVHPSWGSKASDKIRNYFFLPEPEEFNTWCRPDDRQWQLLTTMVTMSEFTSFPYCTAEFFMMNMKVLSPKTGKVRARNGHVFVEIATTRNIGKTVVVKYNLVGKKLLKPRVGMNGHAGGESTQRGMIPKEGVNGYAGGESTHRGLITSRLHEIEQEGEEKNDEISTPSAFPTDLDTFVFMWRKDAHFMFNIQLPVSGVYLFSVEAGHINSDYSVSEMVIVAEIKIYCFDNVHEEDIDMFPDVPEIGWGVTPHCLVRGIRPISHVDGEVFVLPDADTTIRFELDHEYEFDVEMIGENFADDLQQYVSHNVHNNLLTIKVRIPGEGHYGLKIHAKGDNDVDFVNVCNYFLVFNKISSNIEKFPKRMIREKLERATEGDTRHGLKEALDDFILHNVPDRGEVKKAKDKIGFFDDKKALSDAIKRKNPKFLQKSIQDAKKSKFTEELEDDIKRAELMLARLNRMEGYLHPIAKLQNSTLAEIRCYTWPPEVVRNVLAAVYVLLGEDYEYLQDWDYIQSLLAKVGKEGLKNKVLNLDMETVPQRQVDLADIIIDPHKLDEAREASTGTAALYQWVNNICTEKKSQQASVNSSSNKDNTQRKLKVKYPQKENGKAGHYESGKFGQYGSMKGRQYEVSSGGQNGKVKVNSLVKGKGGQYDNRHDTNRKSNDRKDSKQAHETNISPQHRFSKPDKKTNNILGMIIIDERSSSKSKSPNSKGSPTHKSPSSKNASPMQKNLSPAQRSPASKNISPASKNVSPASKNVSPAHRSPANKYVSPTQKSPSNKSPNQKSPSQKSLAEKSPAEKSQGNRFHVIKSDSQKSPPIVPSDSPPHRSPLQRPPYDEVLTPVGLSPVPQSDEETFKNFSPISPEEK